jgi:hypothetical protein
MILKHIADVILLLRADKLKVQLSPANREATFKQVSWSRGQDSQARPCLCLRLGDVELPSLVFYLFPARSLFADR